MRTAYDFGSRFGMDFAYASQHTLGEAADIRLPLTPYTSWSDNKQHTDLDIAHQWMDWLEHHVDFDQLILETANGKDYSW